MRRKLGILILTAITVLAGTQEALHQFDGLRSSLNDLTRASLWSGLIVYAQPVADGKLPAPQIYYLIPQPQAITPAAPPAAVLADNSFDGNAAKTETKNNHIAEEVAAASAEELLPPVPPTREIEDAAMSELALDKTPAHVIAAHAAHVAVVAAPKLERARVYEEVARNMPAARKFKQDADVLARVFVKEFDAAKLNAEITRLAAMQEQLETAKLKSLSDAEPFTRRLELKAVRRHVRPERERLERIRTVAPFADRRAIVLPEISGVGCEKTTNAKTESLLTTNNTTTGASKSEANVEATLAAIVGVVKSVINVSEPSAAAETGAPAAFASPLPSSTSWALGCDTEPEYR
jgi:hypothetical protein